MRPLLLLALIACSSPAPSLPPECAQRFPAYTSMPQVCESLDAVTIRVATLEQRMDDLERTVKERCR